MWGIMLGSPWELKGNYIIALLSMNLKVYNNFKDTFGYTQQKSQPAMIHS